MKCQVAVPPSRLLLELHMVSSLLELTLPSKVKCSSDGVGHVYMATIFRKEDKFGIVPYVQLGVKKCLILDATCFIMLCYCKG